MYKKGGLDAKSIFYQPTSKQVFWGWLVENGHGWHANLK